SQGSKTHRPSGGAIDEVRAGDQSPDRPHAGPSSTADVTRHRRRGDRVNSAMHRRSFLTLLGGAAAASPWSLAARAQQDGRVRRIGVLLPYAESDQEAQARVQTFRHTLVELGWVEGRNLRIDVRWAGTDLARQRSQARELVELAPQVIMTATLSAT